MIYLKETTDWSKDTEINIPNHTYILEGSKMIGYIKQGETQEIMFSVGIPFDKRGRTFETLSNQFNSNTNHICHTRYNQT